MKVKLKNYDDLLRLVREGKIQHQCSDSGEWQHFGVGNLYQSFWFDDFGKEYLVVDHPKPLNKEVYEKTKILFDALAEDQSE